jgi:hypothetical protein
MFQKLIIGLYIYYIKPIGLATLRRSHIMSKNYLELQTYFKFLDPDEQPSIPVKNKVIINPNNASAYSPPEFQSDNEDLFKGNPEF